MRAWNHPAADIEMAAEADLSWPTPTQADSLAIGKSASTQFEPLPIAASEASLLAVRVLSVSECEVAAARSGNGAIAEVVAFDMRGEGLVYYAPMSHKWRIK